MTTSITTFDESTSHRILRMLRDYERRPPEIGNRHGRDVSPAAREIRWGRTTTNYYYPTYPTAGPAYVVEFGDYDPSPDPPYPGATITNTFTAYSPEWQEVAVDPSDGALIAEGTVVRIERHDGRYWIRPASTPSGNPFMLRDSNVVLTGGSSGPRGGSYGTTEYYTVGYQEYIGSQSANNVTGLEVSTAGDPFFSVAVSGLYLVRLSMQCILSGWATAETYTYTTGAASAGTSHTHPVDTYAGIGAVCQVSSYLERRVGGSGSWTYLGRPSLGMATLSGYSLQSGLSSAPYGSATWECLLNLTAGWQVRQSIYLDQYASTTDHELTDPYCQVTIQYLGDESTAVSIP